MAEYIKREDVLALTHYDGVGLTRWEVVEADDIKAIPAADVAPVVHARWVHDHYEQYSGQFEIVKCTNCDYEAYAMAVFVGEGNYCPNCGAKMDLEK